ncbi:MAG: helix-turn-helix transcriptional regulator [Magnetospirillum sp.]|nr:helix-turn-helix transcriptional regulator [Magnetospirillum sp.]
MDTKQLFGLRLQALRKERGLSQERLAELIDRSKDAVSKMERGINLPAFDTLLRLADQLGVSLRDLVGDLDAPGITGEWVEQQARLAAIVRDMDAKTLGVLVDQADALRRLMAPPRRPTPKGR